MDADRPAAAGVTETNRAVFTAALALPYRLRRAGHPNLAAAFDCVNRAVLRGDLPQLLSVLQRYDARRSSKTKRG